MKYLFDLDGTVTEVETLPRIAANFGLEETIKPLTQAAIDGRVPFPENFRRRVQLLSHLSTSDIVEVVSSVPLNSELVDFIRNNASDCAIVTGNYRGWIAQLVAPLNCAVFASEGLEDSAGRVVITSILNKADVVKKFQQENEFVVFIGDGNNDAEAMAQSDVSIAVGFIHEPANAVLAECDFVTYSPKALVRVLNQIRSNTEGTTAVITAAGTGSRLDLGIPKALLQFMDRSLVSWHLNWLADVEDVRIVVGYQASDVMHEALKFRRDVLFVLNREFRSTHVGWSAYLAARFARKMVLLWDGDLIVHPDDLQACLNAESEFLGISPYTTDDGWFVELSETNQVVAFTKTATDYEWSGPACIRRSRIIENYGHIFEFLQPALPIPSRVVRALDIDTAADFAQATQFMNELYGQ